MKLAKICLDPLSNSNNRRTPPPPPRKIFWIGAWACYKECGERECAIHVCMYANILPNCSVWHHCEFSSPKPYFFVWIMSKKPSYFLCIVLSYKKNIKIFKIVLCKVIRDRLLIIKYRINCDIKKKDTFCCFSSPGSRIMKQT